MKKFYLSIVLAVFTAASAMAQLSPSQINSKDYGHWSIALGIGADYYRLHPYSSIGAWDELSFTAPQLSVEYTHNPLFGFGFQAGLFAYNRRLETKGENILAPGRTIDLTLYESTNLANLLFPCRKGGWQKWSLYGDIGGGIGLYSGYLPGRMNEPGIEKPATFDSNYSGFSPMFSFFLNSEYNLSRMFALGVGFGYRTYLRDNMGGKWSGMIWQDNVEPMNNDGWNLTVSLRFKIPTKKTHIRDIYICDYAATADENQKNNKTPELLKKLQDVEKQNDALGRKLDDMGDKLNDLKGKDCPETTSAGNSSWTRDRGNKNNPWQIKGVNFIFDKTKLIDKSNPDLKTVLAILTAHYDEWSELKIDGHTDSFGTAEYNKKLGLRRAEAIRDFFIQNGFAEKKFVIESFGEEKPLVPNTAPNGKDDPAGRQENRRVELYIIK
ncbi:MAG: OmpA family protein [Paludibacter sp.]|jgi:outer membrane protein OmpA-like peptidoglycan-associated protein|nr:OmpA family protein [Paludibacter sp.]